MIVGVVAVIGATAALIATTSPAAAHQPVSAPGGECLPGSQAPLAPYERFNRGTDAPILVTEDCVDPRYNTPQIDLVESGTTASGTPYTHIHGRFLDSTPGPVPQPTPATFSFYFPTAPGVYQGRFYVGPVHQLRLTGDLASPGAPSEVTNLSAFGVFLTRDEVDTAAAGGAYLVEYSPNADYALTARDAIAGWGNPDSQYRVAAAAAKYSRQLAQTIYGFPHRPYGYLFGGSGGAYISISNAEHTIGVWDGVLPFVMGHPLAIPGDFTVRLHALRQLRINDKWPAVVDASDPGSLVTPYDILNAEESSALREATLLGFPLRGWYQHAGLAGGPFFLVAAYPPIMDPTFVDDFWTLPGYLGTDPTSSVVAARVEHATTVTAASAPAPVPDYNALGPAYNTYFLSQYVSGPARTVTLASLPAGTHDYTNDFHLHMLTGAAAGKRVKIGMVDLNTNTITFGGGEDPSVVNMIAIGDQVRVENSLYLALQTHHRHQVPYEPSTPGGIPGGSLLYGWDQFEKLDGTPKYPQRLPPLVGPVGNYNSAGSVSTGHFHAPLKVLVAQSEMDIDAFSWCADWYRTMVQADKQAQGQNLDDHFRIYLTDHAQHTGGGAASTRTVAYSGVLEQGLRDLAKWAEQGVPPPASTSYHLVDNELVPAATAAARHGIQPVVNLKANGSVRAAIPVGGSVNFTATIEVPPGAGKVVGAQWDFDGDETGLAWTDATVPIQETVNLAATQTYSTAGTYFPALRGTSQREGDAATPYARIDNLGRARVVVCDYANDPDDDGDGIPDACDSCPFVANPGQEDTGGLNTSEPDGIGNACQCGDVTGNGIVNGQDANAISRHGLGQSNPTFAVAGNCDVSGNGSCNGQDGNAVKRAALGVGLASNPLYGQRCHNAVGTPVPPNL
jgi:dockerin type I repeat protein